MLTCIRTQGSKPRVNFAIWQLRKLVRAGGIPGAFHKFALRQSILKFKPFWSNPKGKSPGRSRRRTCSRPGSKEGLPPPCPGPSYLGDQSVYPGKLASLRRGQGWEKCNEGSASGSPLWPARHARRLGVQGLCGTTPTAQNL